MNSVLHSGLQGQADPVVSVSTVPDERISPLVSSSQDKTPPAGPGAIPSTPPAFGSRCRQEGISRRTMARRLGIGLREVQAQEQESADLPLSTLYRWKEVLNVPISDLLEEDAGEMSAPVMFRAKLLLVMRTAVGDPRTDQERGHPSEAQFLVEQLVQIMPELKDTTPWPSFGECSGRRESGRAARLRLPADLMRDLDMPAGGTPSDGVSSIGCRRGTVSATISGV